MYFRRIEDLRKDHDYTIKYISEYLGINRDVYKRYEDGKRSIPVDLLDRLADHYKTSVDYLMGRTDQKRPYPKKTKY